MTSMTSFLPTSLLVLVLLLGLCFCEANFDAQGLNQSNSKDDAIFHTSRRTVRNVNYSTSSAENSRKFRLNYTLLTANSPDCKPSLSDSFPVLVQYRMMLSGESSYDNSSTLREWLDFSSASASSLDTTDCEMNLTSAFCDLPVKITVRSFSLLFPTDISQVNDSQFGVELRFVQSDHRGGFCDCWALTQLDIVEASENTESTESTSGFCGKIGRNYNSLTTFLGDFQVTSTVTCAGQTIDSALVGFCRGSASVLRGFVLVHRQGPLGIGIQGGVQCDSEDVVVGNGKEPPKIGDECDQLPHIEVKFDLEFPNNRIDSFDEGVEFAFRNLNCGREWIPLAFYTIFRSVSFRDDEIEVGDIVGDSLNLRGYNTSFTLSSSTSVQLKICDSEILQSDALLNFRWLQTVVTPAFANNDVAELDNVKIMLVNPQLHSSNLFTEDFNNQDAINNTRWTDDHRMVLLNNDRLQFGSTAPTFTVFNTTDRSGRTRESTIVSREISTVNVTYSSFLTQLSYTIITATSPDCLITGMFMFTLPQLQYRRGNSPWMNMETDSIISKLHEYQRHDMQLYSVTNALANISYGNLISSEPIQFHFIQKTHRGGLCDCWAVTNLTLFLSSTSDTQTIFYNYSKPCDVNITWSDPIFHPAALDLVDQNHIDAGFCQDSASVPREFFVQIGSSTNIVSCDPPAVKEAPTDCTQTHKRVEISFDYEFRCKFSDCKGIQTEFELSFRNLMEEGPGEWVPLMYLTKLTNTSLPPFVKFPSSNFDDREANRNIILRGYRVPYVIESRSKKYVNVSICGDTIFQYPLQFRWLQTSYIENDSILDSTIIDNVVVRAWNDTHAGILFEDCFDNQTSINVTRWNSNLTYNVHLMNTRIVGQNDSHIIDGALFLYLQPPITFYSHNDTVNYTIGSQQLVTNYLDPRDISVSSNSLSLEIRCSPMEDMQSSLEMATAVRIMAEEEYNQVLRLIENGSVEMALVQLNVRVNSTISASSVISVPVGLTGIAYLLSSIVNGLGNRAVTSTIAEVYLSTANGLLEIAKVTVSNATEEESHVTFSTLLRITDTFALNNINTSKRLIRENIVLAVDKINVSGNNFVGETITPIEEESVKIDIPREVLQGVESGDQIRLATTIFRNMSRLLPETLPGKQNRSVSRLASPVISASFQCDRCTTTNLSTPVKVTFKHLPYDKFLLENYRGGVVKCVFWQFDPDSRPGVVLYSGKWSTEGCVTNFTSSMTTCKCNHLTHFAILLSVQPLQLSRPKTFTLQLIGSIGVSISLVAMAATIFVFIFLSCSQKKPLQNMRNYIHIQLCVSLSVAQLIFVAGIQPNMNERYFVGGVPVGCRLVAVLLHYWFLVSLMWMLMEGIVLYVALVRVFVTYHRRYIATFTVVSYGLPLIYVGGLTVPLGFSRNHNIRESNSYDYGYEHACYLNPSTSFIWAFIAPAILIFIANIGFFIMTIVIKYGHQRKENKEKVQRITQWLKACISLTVIMGLTWIVGILVINFEELFFLAFIFTSFVAFQGLFVFILFALVETKQVRKFSSKLWKSRVAESDFLNKLFGESTLTRKTKHNDTTNNQTAIILSSKGTNEQMTTTSTTKEADGTITNVYFDAHCFTNSATVEEEDFEKVEEATI